MLKIGQLAQIKSDSPYVYEALTQLVNGVNAVGRATGVDPSGSNAANGIRITRNAFKNEATNGAQERATSMGRAHLISWRNSAQEL
jgi:hypothetical protein